MLPLPSAQFPTSHAGLAEALTRGLAMFEIASREVKAEGGIFPAVERLHIDLTGARITRSVRLPHAGPDGGEALRVGAFEVKAQPLYFEDAPLQIALRATDAVLQLARNEAGESLLTLERVVAGDVMIEVSCTDLEAFAHAAIVAAAGEHGVEIKSTHLELTARGPRSLSFRVEIVAKMFIMSAKVAVSGALDIDDALEARISQLECAGDGMIASTATAFLRPHFAKLERRAFPLLALSLGEVKLREVTLTVGESLKLAAQF